MSSDCVLVHMPFAATNRPSIGLGLLQAQLNRASIRTTTLYGNLRFASQSGIKAELLTALTWDSATMFADFLFAAEAFPELGPPNEEFLSHFFRTRAHTYSEIFQVEGWETLEQLEDWVELTRGHVSRYLQDLTEEILDLAPKVVGCSSTFSQHVSSLALLRRLRETAPDVTTILGGANCEAEMGVATHRHFEWVDYVVSGEADDFIVPLVQGILDRGRELRPEDVALGVFVPAHRSEGYPTDPGRSESAPRAVSSRFAAHPAPDYEDYFRQLSAFPDVGTPQDARLVYETSRGCWWGQKHLCRFCGLNGSGLEYRTKPVETILHQLQELIERHQVGTVVTTDNILDMAFFKTLLPRLAEAHWAKDARFFFETKSNLDPEQVERLADAGVLSIQAGIEGLHTEQLHLMKKGVRAHQNIELLKWCVESGVHVVWHILHGLPNEDDDWYGEMAAMIPHLLHLPPPRGLTPVDFCRFSEYFMNPEEWGLSLAPDWRYQSIYPLPEEALRQIAYHFSSVRPIERRSGERRGGLIALRAALLEWRARWSKEPRPTLILHPEADGAARVLDGRRDESPQELPLSPLEHQLLQQCKMGRSYERLVEDQTSRGRTHHEAEAGLKTLLSRNLCLEIDGKILSLPVQVPSRPYPLRTLIF